MDKEQETEKQSEEQEQTGTQSAEKVLESSIDEFSRLARGVVIAGLESLAVTAELTHSFVDKTEKRNETEHGDEDNRLFYLPMDMAGAFMDVLDESIHKSHRVVDKFNEEYKKHESTEND